MDVFLKSVCQYFWVKKIGIYIKVKIKLCHFIPLMCKKLHPLDFQTHNFGAVLENLPELISAFHFPLFQSVLKVFRSNPHRKKSNIVGSGDRGDQEIFPKCEITWLGGNAVAAVIEALAVGAVAPPCWTDRFLHWFVVSRVLVQGNLKAKVY